VAEELTDSEKIDWLWRRVEAERQRAESTAVLLEKEESVNDRLKTIIRQKDVTIEALSVEIRRLGVEVNDARTAATESVREYIEAQKAG
jgi:hypothetical protein